MLLLLQLPQVLVEALEALLPVALVLADPVGGVPKRLGLEAAGPPLGLPALLDEARSLQYLEVFRDRRQAQVEGRGQLGDGRLAAGESGENGPACWIRECGECGAEVVGLRLYFSCWLINLSG